jgi:hypothetical protein
MKPDSEDEEERERERERMRRKARDGLEYDETAKIEQKQTVDSKKELAEEIRATRVKANEDQRRRWERTGNELCEWFVGFSESDEEEWKRERQLGVEDGIRDERTESDKKTVKGRQRNEYNGGDETNKWWDEREWNRERERERHVKERGKGEECKLCWRRQMKWSATGNDADDDRHKDKRAKDKRVELTTGTNGDDRGRSGMSQRVRWRRGGSGGRSRGRGGGGRGGEGRERERGDGDEMIVMTSKRA